jgi:hypothetical protein
VVGINKPLPCRVILVGSPPQKGEYLGHNWPATLTEARADRDSSRVYLSYSLVLIDLGQAFGLLECCQLPVSSLQPCRIDLSLHWSVGSLSGLISKAHHDEASPYPRSKRHASTSQTTTRLPIPPVSAASDDCDL